MAYLLYVLDGTKVERATALDDKQAATLQKFGIAADETLTEIQSGVEVQAAKVESITLNAAGTLITAIEYESGPSELQQAAVVLHTQLNAWADGLDQYGRGENPNHVDIGHEFLRYAHQAAYLVMGNRHTGADLTVAQRVKWAEEMASGAADVTSPLEFYQKLRGNSDISAPTTPRAWASVPGDTTTQPQRLNLGSTAEVQGTVPADLDIVGAGWIGQLTE